VRAARARVTAALGAALLGAGCGPYARPSHDPFLPTRYDFEAFRAAHPEAEAALREPNYLPFMAHRMALRGRKEDVLVFCRWDESQFPLRVHVEPPRIHPKLWDEFKPQEPGVFAEAAWRALESWERALGGVVRFERAPSWTDAALRVELVGEAGPAPAEGVQVLGTTPLARACRVSGTRKRGVLMDVSFRVPVIRVYVADQHGLLPVDQVERNVLHEMGHALGMKGHSPIPADLMYEVARDRRVSRLSREDVASFLALYRVPNGTVYARLRRDEPPQRPPARAPEGPPQLGAQPYVDPRLGFALRAPAGWSLIPARRGVVAIDGLAWDYEGSFQVIVHGYESIAAYVRRHGAGHLRDGTIVAQGARVVAGRPAFQMTVSQRGGSMIEEHLFIETGDGRVIVVIEEAPAELRAGFEPWFDAMLGSLEVLPSQLPPLPSRPARAAQRER
jgi:hypothetical protein